MPSKHSFTLYSETRKKLLVTYIINRYRELLECVLLFIRGTLKLRNTSLHSSHIVFLTFRLVFDFKICAVCKVYTMHNIHFSYAVENVTIFFRSWMWIQLFLQKRCNTQVRLN